MAITMDVPEGQIRDAIAVAITESFSPDRRASLIRDVVRAHLQHKANSYDKQTLLSAEVGKVLREIAIEEIHRMMDAEHNKFAEIIRATLGESFIASICTQLKHSLERQIVASIEVTAHLGME